MSAEFRGTSYYVARDANLKGRLSELSAVATYTALGDSGKLISYRLGVSKATVSNALNAAMRKLKVKTQAQLAEKMRGFAKHFGQQALRSHKN